MKVSRRNWFVRIAMFGSSPRSRIGPWSLCALFWSAVLNAVIFGFVVPSMVIFIIVQAFHVWRVALQVAGGLALCALVIYVITKAYKPASVKLKKAVNVVAASPAAQAAWSVKSKMCPLVELTD